MEKLLTHYKIQTYLTRLDDLLILSNKAGELSLTKICEGLIRELLSILYDDNFVNTNLGISNFPSIDLHLQNKGIAIQVTSNKNTKKITNTFESFFKQKLDKKYSKLIIIILSTKTIDKNKAQENYDDIAKKYNSALQLDMKEAIMNLSDLYNIISNTLSIDRLNKVKSLFEKSFDEIKGVSDLTDYYDELKSLFFETVMGDETGLTLNSIYTEPFFSIHESCANEASKDLTFNYHNSSYELKTPFSVHNFLNNRYNREAEHNNLFANPNANVVFILGYPGQGKTSLCSRFLFDLLTAPREKYVFYLKLRNISDTKRLINNPFATIFNELENTLDSDIQKTMLKNSITVLDGLDELYMKDNLNADDIEIFCKGIIHETEKFKNWNVVITSRHGYINFSRLFKENYIAINIFPLTVDQQKMWLNTYKNFNASSWLTNEKLHAINQKTSQNSYVSELITQPLLLYIIASLRSEIDMEASRAEIYNLLFEQIIERKYSKDGQIENLKSLTKQDLRSLLQEIAFAIFVGGKGYITEEDILHSEIFENYITIIGNSTLSGTLKGILISFYFKERKLGSNDSGNVGIEFFHKSLQEYLTAERIVDNIFFSFLNQDKSDKFILNKADEMLKYLNDLFGKQEITPEIKGFITEILDSKSKEHKEILAERLSIHFDYFFKKDFLYQIGQKDIEPLRKSLLVFFPFWNLLQELNLKRDFIQSDIYKTKKFFSYYNCISSFPNLMIPSINLSYQNFYDTYLTHLYIHEEIAIGVNLDDCMFNNLLFDNCFIKNLMMKHCHISNLEFYNNIIDGLYFFKCELSDLKFTMQRNSKKITFEDCHIDGTISIIGNKRTSILFKNCSFDDKTLQNVRKIEGNIKLLNCSILKMEKMKNRSFKPINIPVEDTLRSVQQEKTQNAAKHA